MKRLLVLLLLAGSSSLATAQSALSLNGGSLNIGSGGQLYIGGNLTNGSGSTLINNGVIKVSGNLTNDATMTANHGTLSLEGSSNQTLNGGSPYVANDVIIDNADGVSLANTVLINGSASFLAGTVTTATAATPMIFAPGSIVSGNPSNSSHVNGFVVKQGAGPFTFPLGDGTAYQPVAVHLSTNSDGLLARYYPADAGSAPYGTTGASATPLVAYNQKEYWDLTPLGSATGTVTIHWDVYNNTGIGNVADLRVAHQAGGYWLNEGAGASTGTIAMGTVTSSAVTSWSPFTLGSMATTSPLPIMLLSFAGMAQGTSNLLSWRTAAEEPGAMFALERSRNGSSFTALGKMDGKGPASAYAYKDEQPYDNICYYRLLIRDAAGSISYSNIVRIRREALAEGISIFPIPATDVLNIVCTNSRLTGQEAAITDLLGHTMMAFRLTARMENKHQQPACR